MRSQLPRPVSLWSARETREPVHTKPVTGQTKERCTAGGNVVCSLTWTVGAAALGEPSDGEATGEATNRRSLSQTRRIHMYARADRRVCCLGIGVCGFCGFCRAARSREHRELGLLARPSAVRSRGSLRHASHRFGYPRFAFASATQRERGRDSAYI